MKNGLATTLIDLGGKLFAFIVQRVQKEPPKRASDIFHAHPSESERLRDAAGMTMVGEPPREDTP